MIVTDPQKKVVGKTPTTIVVREKTKDIFGREGLADVVYSTKTGERLGAKFLKGEETALPITEGEEKVVSRYIVTKPSGEEVERVLTKTDTGYSAYDYTKTTQPEAPKIPTQAERDQGQKLHEYIMGKINEAPIQQKDIVQTSTMSLQQQMAAKRHKEEFEALATIPLRETISLKPPEKIIIKEKIEGDKLIQEGILPYTETGEANPEFNFRSEFDEVNDRLKSFEKDKSKIEQVASNLGYKLATYSPIVTLPQFIFPGTEYIKWSTGERLVAGIKLGSVIASPFLPPELSIGLGYAFSGITYKERLPAALKGDPEAIADIILASGTIVASTYGLYKDLTKVVDTKVELYPKSKSVLFGAEKEGIEIGGVKIEGEVVGRTKADVIMDYVLNREGETFSKHLDLITGSGKTVATELSGDIAAYGDIDFKIGERFYGKTLSELTAKLSQEQIDAFGKGEMIKFQSYDRSITDLLNKESGNLRTLSTSTFENRLKMISETPLDLGENLNARLIKSMGDSERIFDMVASKHTTSTLVGSDIEFGINVNKLSLEGLATQKAVTVGDYTRYATEVLKFTPKEFTPPSTDLGVKTALDQATKQMTQTLTQNIKASIEVIKPVETRLISPPTMIAPSLETKTKQYISTDIDKTFKVLDQQTKQIQIEKTKEITFLGKDKLKSYEKDLLAGTYKPVNIPPIQDVGLRSKTEIISIVDTKQDLEKITAHIQKQVKKLEFPTSEITKTKLDLVPPVITHVPIDTFKIRIPPPPDIPDLWGKSKEFGLFARSGKEDMARVPSIKFGYTPSLLAVEYNIKEKVKNVKKMFTTGLEIRPIPVLTKKKIKGKRKKSLWSLGI